MSDPEASVDEGWNRYYVKSSAALQRDLSVYRDESFEDQVFTIVGDKHRAQIVDAGGIVVMTAVVKGIPAQIEYTNADGTLAGKLKANSIFSKERSEFTLPDGREWAVVQSGALGRSWGEPTWWSMPPAPTTAPACRCSRAASTSGSTHRFRRRCRSRRSGPGARPARS